MRPIGSNDALPPDGGTGESSLSDRLAAASLQADLARLRRIEEAARAAMRAGWFTTNDAGDRAADALRAALGDDNA
jgi:hypothetical protein